MKKNERNTFCPKQGVFVPNIKKNCSKFPIWGHLGANLPVLILTKLIKYLITFSFFFTFNKPNRLASHLLGSNSENKFHEKIRLFSRTTLFLRQCLEIGDSWSQDLCVYLHTSIYIGFYNRQIDNSLNKLFWILSF